MTAPLPFRRAKPFLSTPPNHAPVFGSCQKAPAKRQSALAHYFHGQKHRMSRTKIIVEGLPVAMERLHEADYISLTDIAKYGNEQNDRANPPANTISNWLRNAQTLRYLQAWEQAHNPNFKLTQMSEFRLEATNHRTSVSPKRYIEETGAIGLITKAGNMGGPDGSGGPFGHRTRILYLGFAGVQSLVFQGISTAQTRGI